MSDIENYRQNRAVRESSIRSSESPESPYISVPRKVPFDKGEGAKELLENLFDEEIEKAKKSRKADKVDHNDNPAYYYTTMRVDDGHLAIKIRVSLIAYLAIVTSTAPDRRSIKKLLYKILQGFKKPKGATNIQNIIVDKIIEYIVKTTGEGVDDYEGYCTELGGAALGKEE